MWLFYILIINMIISAAVLSVISNKKMFALIYLILNIGLLAFLSMFRSTEVGIDTDNYVSLFYEILNSSNLAYFTDRYEIGFIYLNKLLGLISPNHQILFIVTSIYIFSITGRFIYKYSTMVWFSVVLFFCLRYFDISLSGIRQMLAIATVLLSYDFIVKKKPIKFVICVLVATSFHNAAIVFLAAYPLSKYKLDKKFITITTISSIILFLLLDRVLIVVLNYFPRYSAYIEGSGDEVKLVTMLGLLVTVIILIAGEVFYGNLSFNKDPFKRIGNESKLLKSREVQIQSVFIFVACTIMFIALQVDMFQRFKNIYGIFAIVYLPNAINQISNKWVKAFVILFSVFLFLVHIIIIHTLRPEWQNSFPFKFFWN